MKRHLIQTYSTHLPHYCESQALQELIQSVYDRVDCILARLDDPECAEMLDDQFTISVGGKSYAFFLGGPQVEALHVFVERICDENLYEFDKKNLEVKGW